MEKTESIMLENLSKNMVNVLRRVTYEIDGNAFDGSISSDGYVNSAIGRIKLEAEIPEPYRSAVLAVWGDTPTVADPPTEAPEEGGETDGIS